MVTMSEAAKAGAANATATSNALSRDFMGASSLFLELYPPTAKLSPQSFCDRRGPQLLRPSEGLFEDRQRLVELLEWDGQRRAKRDHIFPADLEAEPALKAAIHEPLSQSGRIVAANLDAEIATEATHVADDRVAGLHSLESLKAALAERVRPINQLLFFDDLERREPCCASDGTLLVRIISGRRVRRAIEPCGGKNRRERHDSSAEALAKDQDIWRRRKLLAGVERPGARQAARNLIEYQKRAMTPARVLHPRPEFPRRRLDRRPAHGLGDQRRHVPLNL